VTASGAAPAELPLAAPRRRPVQAIASGLLLTLWILFLAAMAYRG
jgi:hypothetical protein